MGASPWIRFDLLCITLDFCAHWCICNLWFVPRDRNRMRHTNRETDRKRERKKDNGREREREREISFANYCRVSTHSERCEVHLLEILMVAASDEYKYMFIINAFLTDFLRAKHNFKSNWLLHTYYECMRRNITFLMHLNA